MAKERSIVCDRDEVVLKAKVSDRPAFLNLTKDQIKYIQFDKCSVKKLFKTVLTEKIEIATSKVGNPVVYYQTDEGEYFNQYKQELLRFAENNRIKLIDNVTDGTR